MIENYKIVTLCGAGLPVLPGVAVTRHEFESNAGDVITKIRNELGFPVFVKPANLGSSIGVSRADDDDGLRDSLSLGILRLHIGGVDTPHQFLKLLKAAVKFLHQLLRLLGRLVALLYLDIVLNTLTQLLNAFLKVLPNT